LLKQLNQQKLKTNVQHKLYSKKLNLEHKSAFFFKQLNQQLNQINRMTNYICLNWRSENFPSINYKIKKVQIACSTQSNANGMTICKIVTIYITSNLKYEMKKKSHSSTTCDNVKTIRNFGSTTYLMGVG